MCISPEAYEFVREKVKPFPSKSDLRKKLGWLHAKPGMNMPAYEFLKQLAPKMNPAEEIATIMIDEMKLSERGDLDQKIDAFIGPHAYANQILVKSIFGNWQVPIYTAFDSPIRKKKLMQVIRKLEAIGIKIVFIVCDQGPRNLSLAKSLGISSEKVSFPNPADETRDIFFSYDVVHLIKSLRFLQ